MLEVVISDKKETDEAIHEKVKNQTIAKSENNTMEMTDNDAKTADTEYESIQNNTMELENKTIAKT